MRWGQRILSKVISVWQKWFPTCCHHSQWWMKAKRLNSGCFIFSNQKPFRHNFRSFWTKVSIMKFLLSGGNFSTQICDNLQFTSPNIFLPSWAQPRLLSLHIWQQNVKNCGAYNKSGTIEGGGTFPQPPTWHIKTRVWPRCEDIPPFKLLSWTTSTTKILHDLTFSFGLVLHRSHWFTWQGTARKVDKSCHGGQL